jgi:S1-C subfamily serine protease
MSTKRIVTVSVVILLLALSALSIVTAQDDARPFLGVGIEPNEAGAQITQVMPDSPAATAGLQIGDIITALDGKDVTAETLADVIQSYTVGDNVQLNVLRDGETLELDAALAARADEQTFQGLPALAERPYLGVTLEESDNQIVVREVAPNSPAAEAGLQAGDVIVSINSTAVTTSQEAVELIRGLNAGDIVTLEIRRTDETLTVEATLSSMSARPFDLSEAGDIVIYNSADNTWQITALTEESPLYQAGLRAGDNITAIDGEQYDPTALSDYLNGLSADANVTVTVDRNGDSQEFTVTPEALNALNTFGFDIGQIFGEGGLPFMMAGNTRLGVQFVTLDAQTAADHNIDQTEGALITAVEPDSPAATAGMLVDDVVTAVSGDKVDAEHTLRDRLFAYEPGDVVTLDIVRNGESMSIDVTLAQVEMSSDMMPFNFGEMRRFFGPDGRFQFELPRPQAPAAVPNI